MTDDELDAAIYDLFLVGCYHWRNIDSAKTSTLAYPVLGALWQSGCYREILYRPLTTRSGLRDRVVRGSRAEHVKVATKPVIKAKLEEADKISDGAHLVILVRPTHRNAVLVEAKVFSNRGYLLSLTPDGMDYAARATAQYPELTRQAFRGGVSHFWSLPQYERQKV